MPYVQLDGLQYPLEPGETSVGAGPDAKVSLQGVPQQGVFAVLEMSHDASVIVRRSGSVVVRVNGLELLEQPSPLLHGDKLEIFGRELYFGDDRRAGSTMYVPSVQLSEGEGGKGGGHRTSATGGRLVSLVDGREYPIPEGGLVLGRDPDCDVVIPSTEVSRRHAGIAPTGDGYQLTDTSTNGLLVNGNRVSRSQLLGRGDVLRIAEEEFRFYADNAPPPRPLLATLEGVGSSIVGGKRFEIRTALLHVGRGEHNDIVLADESVSDSHAKVHRREEVGWTVVDLDSTNGTYLSGRRIHMATPLEDGADLRFGGVKLVFHAAERPPDTGKATRVIAPVATTSRSRSATPSHIAAKRSPLRPQPPQQESRGIPAIVWLLLSLLLAITAFIFLTSR
jgi:pSer/pThr/pTyr-binding forkhead associated (FHA) protein